MYGSVVNFGVAVIHDAIVKYLIFVHMCDIEEAHIYGGMLQNNSVYILK